MKRIFKYPLDRVSVKPQMVMLPEHSVIIKVGVRKDRTHNYDRPTLWILLDDSCPLEPRYFDTFETGENLGELWADKYVGSAVGIGADQLVCHVFEVTEPKGLVKP